MCPLHILLQLRKGVFLILSDFSLFKELPLPLCSRWFTLHLVKQQYVGFLINLERYLLFRPMVGLSKGFISSCLDMSFTKEHLHIGYLFEPFGETYILSPYLMMLLGNIPYFLFDSKYSFTFYFPHRVRRQFGLEQSIPQELSLYSKVNVTFSHFIYSTFVMVPRLKGTRVCVDQVSHQDTITRDEASFRDFIQILKLEMTCYFLSPEKVGRRDLTNFQSLLIIQHIFWLLVLRQEDSPTKVRAGRKKLNILV